MSATIGAALKKSIAINNPMGIGAGLTSCLTSSDVQSEWLCIGGYSISGTSKSVIVMLK
jgi:hypothetical protein